MKTLSDGNSSGIASVKLVTVIFVIAAIAIGGYIAVVSGKPATTQSTTTSPASSSSSTSSSTIITSSATTATSSASVTATSTPTRSSTTQLTTTTSVSTSSSTSFSTSPIQVTFENSTYQKASSSSASGWFTNGQSADMMLGGFGFDNSGGALQFNHPGQVSTDGTHVVLADTWNNRVLLWNSVPSSNNVPPDIVLGQPNFGTNNPGSALNQMNWPISASIAGGKLVVADTYNNRILVWNSLPTKNDQPADFQIVGAYQYGPILGNSSLRDIKWPWGVWTDGQKMAVTNTVGGLILIWNTFPTQTNQSADIYIYGGGIGTPRTITSDGTHLIIGDHNACLQNSQLQATTYYQLTCSAATVGSTWFWRSFPTHDNQLPDFYMNEPSGGGAWMTGQFTSDGRLLLMGTILYEWNAFPINGSVAPNLQVGSWLIPGQVAKYTFIYPFSLAIVGPKVLVSENQGNKILVFNSIPTSPTQFPDLVIGAPDINSSTLDSNFMLGNPLPVTDGKSLIEVSDASYMYVWKNLPNESGAHPDVVYNFHTLTLAFSPECAVINNGTLVIAGFNGDPTGPQIFIWNKIPLNGELPDREYSSIGGVKFGWMHGCAWDNKYFYIADLQSNLIYVWKGLPTTNLTSPLFALPVNQPTQISSDGTHLVVSSGLGLDVYNVAGLSASSQPVIIGGARISNGLKGLVADGHLFAVDTGFNRLQIWDNISQALNGGSANITIGCLGSNSYCSANAMIGGDKLFWPYSLAFDGHYLWVGETKFSNRLLRFSLQPGLSPSAVAASNPAPSSGDQSLAQMFPLIPEILFTSIIISTVACACTIGTFRSSVSRRFLQGKFDEGISK